MVRDIFNTPLISKDDIFNNHFQINVRLNEEVPKSAEDGGDALTSLFVLQRRRWLRDRLGVAAFLALGWTESYPPHR